MANSGDADRGRSVVARWRMLAERRLNYLIELYETGRWKVYYKEPEFLKVIQEARVALATWEQLAPPDPVQDKPVEVAIAQMEDAAVLPSPFTQMPSTHGVEAQGDLRKA
ncbi:TIGR03809 family protein [Afipia massiliensis]|uniref:Putative repeat protein (TIGR03809 family) n=1 Tax=Afipia massiliensis TaxID=211460 RepID=A0A4U6BUJ6_9BRAD|nr:TIGR03809 family protein [Afipia massiliensis]MBB5050616.1 putative repeat protein (TIGR03809 family) [Afipia massiliensis]TKT73741.1 TIGR03809 family protein [Afipia massiliensis]